MEALSNTEVLACTDVTRWESWLADHHEQSSGIWLVIAKKRSDKVSVTISDALDVALCYGWIDSQRKSYDTNYYLQRYSPRRPRSPWSKLNVERVEALIDAGRMRAPGLAEVAAAEADGRWAAAYEPQRMARLPPDLADALEQNERARTAFEQLDETGQYAVILPVLKATTPAIRVIRLQKAIAKLEAAISRRAE
ncbi:MAG: YdeI/OmpD-associated family protein [Candidatus Dormibacteraeota bacterium]|nr:YdeI/OmpD-associated family protein [Candidatus Dormibacteraeota bacterium]